VTRTLPPIAPQIVGLPLVVGHGVFGLGHVL